jgi:hypothetical protein
MREDDDDWEIAVRSTIGRNPGCTPWRQRRAVREDRQGHWRAGRSARSGTAISTWCSSSRAPAVRRWSSRPCPTSAWSATAGRCRLKRSFFEYHALTRQEARAPGSVPAILHFDEGQALIIMEFLSPHIILRRALIEGRQLPNIARDIGLFMARTLFRGSDLHMAAKDRKADLALFADNVELCDITESLVFSDPYFNAKMNRHTSPQLDGLVAELRADRDLKVEAQRLKHHLRRQCRDAAAWRFAFRLDHGHRHRNPDDRSGVRLLRSDGLRCRHAACQFLDVVLLAARPRAGGKARRHARLSTRCDGRDLGRCSAPSSR